jgi:hypothetical protein
MEERDQNILEHIGLYYLSLRVALERLFFDGKEAACGNVIKRLAQKKLIATVNRGFPGNLSYYQLTPQSAELVGVPLYRTETPSGQALPDHLAVLWFCTMNGKKRKRLERIKLEQFFGKPLPGPHCIEFDEDGTHRIIRIFPPAANDVYQLQQVRKHLQLLSAEGLGDWLKSGSYGVAALIATEPHREQLSRLIADNDATKGKHIITEIVPVPLTLKEVINALYTSSTERRSEQ